MRRYETIIILDTDLSDENRGQFFKKITGLITQDDGFLALLDEWGDKKLAYEIKKKSRGFYVRFDFCGHGDTVNEIERHCRIDEKILKYMTVLLEKDVDVDALKEEIKSREAAEAEAKAEAEKTDSGVENKSADSDSSDEGKASDASESAADDNKKEETEAGEKE